MEARMKSPVMTVPGALEALLAFNNSAKDVGVPETTLELVHLRVSQINGCSLCVDLHRRGLERSGESLERSFAVAAWREAPYFTDAERAALALAESVTRLADRPDPVPDEVWDEAARHYDETQLSGLVIQIAAVNVWNRLNAATKQVAGSFTG